MWLGTVQLDKL